MDRVFFFALQREEMLKKRLFRAVKSYIREFLFMK